MKYISPWDLILKVPPFGAMHQIAIERNIDLLLECNGWWRGKGDTVRQAEIGRLEATYGRKQKSFARLTVILTSFAALEVALLIAFFLDHNHLHLPIVLTTVGTIFTVAAKIPPLNTLWPTNEKAKAQLAARLAFKQEPALPDDANFERYVELKGRDRFTAKELLSLRRNIAPSMLLTIISLMMTAVIYL